MTVSESVPALITRALKTYRVTLPPDIPAVRFWSFTAHDN
jgi:hypothetical protein